MKVGDRYFSIRIMPGVLEPVMVIGQDIESEDQLFWIEQGNFENVFLERETADRVAISTRTLLQENSEPRDKTYQKNGPKWEKINVEMAKKSNQQKLL